MLRFENCDVSINGTGILVESASLTTNTPVAINEILGFGASYYNLAGILQNSVQLSYLLEPSNEPNLKTISGLKIKQDDNPLTPLVIVLGGISGTFYLSDYSISTREHDAVGVSVSYVGYTPVSGGLVANAVSVSYNASNSSGIAHYYTTALVGRQSSNIWYSSKNLYSCNYNFRCNILPVLTLGTSTPKSVQFMGAEESINLIHDDFVPVGVYGLSAFSGIGLPPGYQDFSICFAPFSGRPVSQDNLNTNCSIVLTSGLVTSQQVNISTAEIAKVNTVVIRNY